MWAGVYEVSTRPNPPFNLTPASSVSLSRGPGRRRLTASRSAYDGSPRPLERVRGKMQAGLQWMLTSPAVALRPTALDQELLPRWQATGSRRL